MLCDWCFLVSIRRPGTEFYFQSHDQKQNSERCSGPLRNNLKPGFRQSDTGLQVLPEGPVVHSVKNPERYDACPFKSCRILGLLSLCCHRYIFLLLGLERPLHRDRRKACQSISCSPTFTVAAVRKSLSQAAVSQLIAEVRNR